MIYLIITTSIDDRFNLQNKDERKERYIYAITKTLEYLPNEITPIIVENNGMRNTFLNNFYHNNKNVNVLYTENNKKQFKSKGSNELFDIKDVIYKCDIKSDDIIIKLTGRYAMLSDMFFKEVINNEYKYDAFVKFFGSCSLKFEEYDCILGCYAIRCNFMQLWNPYSIDNYNSAEIAFARYVRFCGARLKEIDNLDVECCFSENNRKLIV
jgi:hypothetical protein